MLILLLLLLLIIIIIIIIIRQSDYPAATFRAVLMNALKTYGTGGFPPLLEGTIESPVVSLCLFAPGTHWIGGRWNPEPVFTFWIKSKTLALAGNWSMIPQTSIPHRSHCTGWTTTAALIAVSVIKCLWCSFVYGQFGFYIASYYSISAPYSITWFPWNGQCVHSRQHVNQRYGPTRPQE